MTTIQLYRKHKAGEVSREKFLYEVRKDTNLPWVINTTSYTDAVKILKNKGIISEMDNNVTTDPAVDRVNPYFLKRGVNKLLSKEDELTNDSYIKALNKAGKALAKNPHAFDDEMFANNEDVKKEDEKLEMQDVKKGNLNDKDREMKKVKIKTKAKSLKETALEELTNSLKKKESINEDTHWKHTVGSQVTTPEGPGIIKEINGGTLTVEMKDGSLKDFQINTIDHHTEKANEAGYTSEPTKDEPSKDDVKDMWAKWDKDVESGKNPYMTKQLGQELPYEPQDIKTLLSKLKEYISKHGGDKEKMSKIKEAVKKLKEAGEKTALVTTASGQTTAVDYKTDDELKSIGDNTDVRSVKTGMGRKIKGN